MGKYVALAFLLGFASSYFWLSGPEDAIATAASSAMGSTKTSCPGNTRAFGFIVPTVDGGSAGVICR